MRPIDRVLGREPAPTSRYAVRRFGTTPADAAAEDAAAQGSATGAAGGNLTTGGTRVERDPGGIINQGSGV